MYSSDRDTAIEIGNSKPVQDKIAEIDAAHLPYCFPEVFMRDNPGFDVIIGNPPWDKVKVEEHAWWAMRFPGLRSMPQKEKNATLNRYKTDRPDLVAEYEREEARVEALRDVIKKGHFPGIGSGDTDVYKAFCWRGWDLLRGTGRTGMVLPRGALSGSGTAKWREAILSEGAFDNVTFLANTGKWVFDDIDGRYTVALTTIRKGGQHTVTFDGPYHSLEEFAQRAGKQLTVSAEEFATWADGAAFPLLPTADTASIFRGMREHPRFDDTGTWNMRPVTELHASGDKKLFDFDVDDGTGIPVYAGASFNLWDPDFGDLYAYADPDDLLDHLQSKWQRQSRTRTSAFAGMDVSDPETLPIKRPRIAFRDVTNQTNQRTVLACLIPPMTTLTHKAPYLLRRYGNTRDEVFVLGVMSSIPFDWYARRYVETNVTFELLSAFPLPNPGRYSRVYDRIVQVSGRLAALDERYADWEAKVSVPVGSVTDEATKQDLIAELDALVALLYGLAREDVTHIFHTFHRGWDYEPRLKRVLQHFDTWDVREAG